MLYSYRMLTQHLTALLSNLVDYQGKDLVISGLCTDSRMAKPGELFLASRGTQLDGRMYIEEAIKQGATAVIYEAEELTQSMQQMIAKYQHQLPMLAIPHLEEKIGLIALKICILWV